MALVLDHYDARITGAQIRDYNLLRSLAKVGTLDVYCFSGTSQISGAAFGASVTTRSPTNKVAAAILSCVRNNMYQQERFNYGRFGNDLRQALAEADVVYASMLYPATYVGRVTERMAVSDRPLIIWDSQNFDPDVWLAREEAWKGVKRWAARLESRRVQKAMREAYEASDLVVTCSHEDTDKLSEQFGRSRLFLVENGVNVNEWSKLAPGPNRRVICIFGSLVRESTAAGAVRFLRCAWPRIREVYEGATLIIAGRQPGRQLVSVATATVGVQLIPNPETMLPIVQRADVIAAPQAFGTGSKVKMFEALASGRHVVATNAAVIGLPENLKSHVALAETPEEWLMQIGKCFDRPLSPYERAQRLTALGSVEWEQLGGRLCDRVLSMLTR